MMLMLVTLGIFSFRRLALDLYPNVEIPVLVVKTMYAGASPEAIEREVTKKIEEAVNPIAGVKHIISYSMEGVSTVVVQFNLEIKINEASQEAQAKIAAIRGELPAEIEEPVIQKVDFSAMPVISVAVKSDSLSRRELSTLVEKKIKPRLENISGVGKVDLVGLSKREVNVEPDPERLYALNMGVDELIGGLSAENVNTPLGRLKSGTRESPLRISGKPATVEGFGSMVIANRGGRPVTLSEVARVTDGVEEERTRAFVSGARAIGINVQKQSGANTVEVTDTVKKTLEKLKSELPEGVKAEVVRDASVFIRESVEDVENSLVLGGILTVLIVFCFLNSWRSTVITGLTLPISVVSSFIAMNFMGMTLNVMTLMALSLAIGLLIDDAIVVRENIVRHLEHGKDHFTAAREGTAEIGLAVLATTFSIVAVFVPVAFMKGIVGRFFFSFGITVTFAVLVSLFVSFTLDPMLSSRWHDPDIERTGKRHLVARLLDVFNDWFDRTADLYKGVIGWALNHRFIVVMAAVAAFAGGLMIFGSLESSFMPSYDRGEFQVSFKTAPDASMNETVDRAEKVMGMLGSIPEIERLYGTIGANDTTVRDVSIYVKLKPKAERALSQDRVQEEVRKGLTAIAGITGSISEAGGFHGEKALQVNLRGDDIDKLKHYSELMKREIYKIPGIVDLEATMEYDIPEYRLTVDRQRAADAGLSSAQIVRTVGSLVGGRTVTTFEDEYGDSVDVKVRLPENLRTDVAKVGDLKLNVPPKNGRTGPSLAPIGDFTDYKMANTPSAINRQGLSRQVVISANLQNLPIGTAVARVKEASKNVPMEPGYRLVFSGEAEDMAESFGYMAEALLLAVVFVYLILAAQFESFIDPLSIMLSLPLSLVGMAGMLKLTGDTISIMSLIGLIMLMGLVTKNAILLVDYAKILIRGGMNRREAVITAGRTRLRPIMMTTSAMIFGMLPLALALGAGAEMRAPMARAVIGGLITSTFLTLLVVPVVYTVMDDFGGWIKRKWAGSGPAAAKTALLLALFLGSALLPAAVSAGEPVTMTLDEALLIASEKNVEILKALETKGELQGKYLEERAAAFPQITLKGAAFAQRTPTEAELTRAPDKILRAGALDVQVNQVLFTWGKVGAAIRAAETGIKTGDDALRAARQAARLGVAQAFYDALLVKELKKLADENLEQKKRHLAEAEKKYALGTATDYDVLSAKVAVENARPEAIRAENRIKFASGRLAALLGRGEREIDPVGALDVVQYPIPGFEEAVKTAFEKRPELDELRHTQGVYEELVTIYRAGDKPRLDLSGTYGRHMLDVERGPSGEGNDWTVGVYATFPLFDGFATEGRVAQAEARARKLKLEEKKLADAVRLGVRDAINLAGEAAETLAALKETVRQAEKLLSMAEQGYELGVKTKLDVDDAMLNLTSARSNHARARRDCLVAKLNLDYAMGVLGEN